MIQFITLDKSLNKIPNFPRSYNSTCRYNLEYITRYTDQFSWKLGNSKNSSQDFDNRFAYGLI